MYIGQPRSILNNYSGSFFFIFIFLLSVYSFKFTNNDRPEGRILSK